MCAPSGPKGTGHLLVPPGAGDEEEDRSRGLSGQFLLRVLSLPFLRRRRAGSGAAASQVQAVPSCTPRLMSSWSVQCHSSSNCHNSLLWAFPHFLASPLPAKANTTLPVPGPGSLWSPAPPRVPPEAKTNSPEGTSQSVQWPRRHTREHKRRGQLPRRPPAE